MGIDRETAERKHDEIKLRALDRVEESVAERRLTLTSRERVLISLAAESGIIAVIEWLADES